MLRTEFNFLEPKFDNRKSFYGKACCIDSSGILGISRTLYSYGTPVCNISLLFEEGTDFSKGRVYLNGDVCDSLLFSNTTLRHIKEFLKQNGFKAESKKQVINDYKMLYGEF